ncbi:Dps family protein [Oceanivirga miroungae]|uniref:Neutrophil activating protein NapA n=1 Tax=Oceanivirga miroungae TaxID=1130046 RepID=A0A6I8MEN1_9FUSO|nr:DNA starvation/stationary phase protection protein [Oceanivirga miroungae]VWL85973.1 neutrophil activating protein NapA [Oceanivirga miroungae]
MEKALNNFLADLAVLSLKVKNYHWNVKGKGFFSIHKELDNIYENLDEQVDVIAERLLALDKRPLSTFKSFLENTKIKEGKNEEVSIDVVFSDLISDFTYMVSEAKDIKVKADEENDFGTSALLDEFILQSEKLLWMLKAAR